MRISNRHRGAIRDGLQTGWVDRRWPELGDGVFVLSSAGR